MNNKILIAAICVIAYFFYSGKLTGQMPDSAPVKQNGGFFGPETPYTIQRAEDAQRQRANEQAKTAYWNNYWHSQNVDRVSRQKAARDQFRQQQLDAEYKARQMVIDKALQRFQQSLDNPEHKKKWWQK